MNIEITILNIKDADAIIVYLYKANKHFVLLIDGGHAGDATTIIKELDKVLTKTGKKGPDLIVCTHYDSDHIGGLMEIVKHYKKEITQLLIHQTSQLLEIPKHPMSTSLDNASIFPSESDQTLSFNDGSYYTPTDTEIQTVLRSIQQEIDLLDLINNLGIPTVEPVVGNFSIVDWPEFEIIGPTWEYYKKLFPTHFDVKDFMIQESLALRNEAGTIENEKEKDPCETLETLKKSRVTNPNLNSAIIKIIVGENTFLFTADAGIDSFVNVPNYKEVLKNAFWLKVPHHGSHNNINCELIKLMAPKIAVISGNKYVNASVVGCFRSIGSQVDITRDSSHHFFYKF